MLVKVYRIPESIGIIEGLKAPLEVLVKPDKVFMRIRTFSKKYGIYFTSMFYFTAWLAASLVTFLLIIPLLVAHGFLSKSIGGVLLSPIKAAFYSFLAPLVFAGLDTLLMALVVLLVPRDRPVYTMLLVRASSLLPYNLRIVILAVKGKLTILSLIMVNVYNPISLTLTFMGYMLTGYGLRRTLNMSWKHSFIAASLPLIYKVAVFLV